MSMFAMLGIRIMNKTVSEIVEPTRRYHSEENFLYSPFRNGIPVSFITSTLKLMSKIMMPEFKNESTNMLNALA